jgi:energy-converting hydrogenase B subunit D
VTAFWALDLLCLAAMLAAAVLVVRLENLNASVMALSAVGTVLALLFLVLDAPDVAHSQVVVGTIALPVLYLLAIGKARVVCEDSSGLGEEGEEERPA